MFFQDNRLPCVGVDDSYQAVGGAQINAHNHFLLLQTPRCDIDSNLSHSKACLRVAKLTIKQGA